MDLLKKQLRNTSGINTMRDVFKAYIYICIFLFQISLVVEWELKDQNGADIFCIQLPAQIID